MKPAQLNDSSVNDAIDTPACQIKGKLTINIKIKICSLEMYRDKSNKIFQWTGQVWPSPPKPS